MHFSFVYKNKDEQHVAIGMTLSQKIFTIIIILFPIINIYQSGINISIGIGDALLLVFLAINMPNVLKKKLVVTDYFFFLVYIIIISFIDVAVINGGIIPVGNLIRIVRHGFLGVIICVYMPHYFNLQYGMYLMKLWSCVVSIGIVFQSLLYYVFHRLQFFWLPVEAFTGGELVAGRISHMTSLANGGNFRPSFVFIEPAGFTQYVIVGVLLFLFCEKRKEKSIIGAGLCSIGILLSTSAGGILVMALGWMVWLMKVLKRAVTEKKIERYICWILLFLLSIVMGVMLFTGVGKMMIRRFSEVSLTKPATSGNLRVLRGFLIFLELHPLQKIFGLGLGNIDDYFTLMQLPMPYGSGEYMNGLAYILNSGGIIGAMLLLSVLFRRMFRKSYFFIALSLIVLVLTLGVSNFNSGPWLIYMAFLLYTKKNSSKAVEV